MKRSELLDQLSLIRGGGIKPNWFDCIQTLYERVRDEGVED